MKDLVLGVIHNYGWNEVKFWVNSLRQSGFDGDAVLLVYTPGADLVAETTKRGVSLIGCDFHSRGEQLRIPPLKVIDIRHFHIWYYLRSLNAADYRYVIATDVRDVIFQCNPSRWIEEHIDGGHGVYLACEGIRVKDEPWNAQFLLDGFGPVLYDALQDKEVMNGGTMFGTFEHFRDFELLLFSLSERNLLFKMDCIDQTSLLLLQHCLSTSDESPLHMVAHEVGWACQCGVTMDPSKIERFRPYLTTKEPIMLSDGMVYTPNHSLYCLVHQWDRVPSLAAHIRERYA